ncbi:hypothetical protein ABMA70_12075 [Halobacteriovorax sp. XZX-3]|uniref:hypothetical protein n=1 Tax=unclassified Halobacteriovorax TaxID=2639665 RepID=UPI000CD1F8ED|nr:hypothetical protein [Halobacteriovorax sp. DA5]POB14071.1 hypothetical protein C0Z22_08405 [Halobacteriovorax sp. DA5]
MKIYHIVWSMIAVLAFLFILTPYYRKKEEKKNKLEREYYSLLKNEIDKEDPSKELIEAAKKVHTSNYIDTDEKLIAQINNDKKMMKAI